MRLRGVTRIKMLSQKNKLLLRELQSNFPLTCRPYQKIAERLGLTEEQVLEKARAFQNKGIIRYIGIVFNPRKLGIVSSLVALSVPGKNLSQAANIINSYPQVTHNYLRRDKFNLWFTLSAPSKSRLLKLVREIKRKTGVKNALNLATLRVFKIDARFKV